MTVWFTADLHLGHLNIIDYCQRPFDDVEEMNRVMIEHWNSLVDHADTVYVVGDFALGKIADTLPIASRLRGHKLLVAGNHDRCWSGNGRRAEGWTERYLSAGFEQVIQGQASVDINHHTVEICHFPYRGDSLARDRFTDWRPADEGNWLIHGHVHEKWAQQGRMINVGVDANDFRPVDIAFIAALIEDGPKNRPIRE